jgi:hypothetical protein
METLLILIGVSSFIVSIILCINGIYYTKNKEFFLDDEDEDK